MQNRQKALNLLGLAMKAGRICAGSESVMLGMSKAKIKLVILASDLHQNTREKVVRLAHKDGKPIYNDFSSQELEHAIGRECKVIGLTDSGFSKALAKLINGGV